MVSSKIKKGNSKLTLSINTKTLNQYKEYCEKEGLTISKQVEQVNSLRS